MEREAKFKQDRQVGEIKGNRLFTSESVTEGHPDKICDQVSDAILDACFDQDKNSRVACECFAGKGFLLIGGEITTKADINPDAIAREVIKNIGYTDTSIGFYYDDVAINCMLNSQSGDIALGVDTGGAGDQGIMFGYACNETPELMPAPIQYAHALTNGLAKYRRNKMKSELDRIYPDGKSQVSVCYNTDGSISHIDTIVVSTQHGEGVTPNVIREIVSGIIKDTLPLELVDKDLTKVYINPTGRFLIGGPKGDTGLTGRKIIVDSYGGYGRHGGGCWSGKDPTKVDRSASYMARFIAKNIVASKVANTCEIQLAYAIGMTKPVAIYINTDAGCKVDRELERIVSTNIDLTPNGIIEHLNLRDIKYRPLAAYGHLGRSVDLAPWENSCMTSLFKGL